ncbi:MAG: hypothetical protein FWH48_10485 [Oscillospiraceae bacterium]|nr:hypothetical protein [Oscillospiraceae bacterium]
MAKEPKTMPLKVTAKLSNDKFQSNDGLIMLDGILYHAWFQKHHPEVLETGQYERSESETGRRGGDRYIGLPLRQLPGNRWAASMGVYEQLSQTIECGNDRIDFFATVGVANMGQYRASKPPAVIRTVKDGLIDFYCIGNKAALLDLLSHIHAIGKSQEIGAVSEWTATEIENDYSLMHPKYGLMRPTPVEEMQLDGYAIMDYAVKPPYHNPKNKKKCYIPKMVLSAGENVRPPKAVKIRV